MSRTKAHQQYKLPDGTILPSVTTILGVFGTSQALVHWAWNLGMQQQDYRKVRDNAGDIGTLAHYLIQCHIKGHVADTEDFTPNDLTKAMICCDKYLLWEKKNNFIPLLVEEQLVSQVYQYGGTIDCYGMLNDEPTLIDHKTGKAIWDTMAYQLAAYKQLLIENGHDVKNARILRIGQDESEGFEERTWDNLDSQWEIFYHALEIHKLQKELKKK